MATAPTDATLDLEPFRRELTGYCYRMLGSGFDAEDAVQETMLRAWRGATEFEGRSSLRSWLYRIATNVCLDALRAAGRRAEPMDLGGPWSADTPLPPPLPEQAFVSPIADDRVLPAEADPAELAELRDSVRLAFVAALQLLPPRQRAVLILRDVLKWQAAEVAELLGSTVASVNSALQRAKAALAERDLGAPAPLDDEHRALLARYVEAFERYDVESLVTLIADDATFTMPPFPLWLRGTPDIAKWYVGQGAGCRGSRLIPVSANGSPAFAAYKQSGPGRWAPFALQVVEPSGGRLVALHHFLDAERLFAAFGLPPELHAEDA
ncbi:MAG TPA: sigma-70 family RNA polymerase sigma factor [Mycobacteriales bacterium]|nr:sigma-70 family RNA polymerase sigma factor [Mycobacteriales bacterium]